MYQNLALEDCVSYSKVMDSSIHISAGTRIFMRANYGDPGEHFVIPFKFHGLECRGSL